MKDPIDLRRFARPGEGGVLVREDGRGVEIRFEQVATAHATVFCERGALAMHACGRCRLHRDGVRVVVAFQIEAVGEVGEGDRVDLALGGAVVLGGRRHARFGASGEHATVVRAGEVRERPRRVRLVDVSRAGIGFETADPFGPGDELTIVRGGAAPFTVRVRVVWRAPGGGRYGARVVAVSAADEAVLTRPLDLAAR